MARKHGPRKPKRFNIPPVYVRAVRPRSPSAAKDGRWYWRAVVNEAGKERSVWTGWATRQEAVEHVGRLVVEGKINEAPPEEDTATIGTVCDLVECWAAWQEERFKKGKISPHTHRNYEASARAIKREIGGITIEALDVDVVQDFVDRDGVASSTAGLELQVFRQAWRWARDRGHIPNRALPRVSRARAKVKPVRSRHTPSRGDIVAVLGCMSGWPRLATWVLFATGARIGAVSRLRWCDFDAAQGAVTFPKTKTGKPRTVAVPTELVEALRDHAGDGDPTAQLFGKEATVAALIRCRYLPRACKAAGVEPFSPHGLRRFASDELIRRGVDPGTYMAVMGHSVKIALEHYRQASVKDQRAAVALAGLGRLDEEEVKVLPFPARGAPEKG